MWHVYVENKAQPLVIITSSYPEAQAVGEFIKENFNFTFYLEEAVSIEEGTKVLDIRTDEVA